MGQDVCLKLFQVKESLFLCRAREITLYPAWTHPLIGWNYGQMANQHGVRGGGGFGVVWTLMIQRPSLRRWLLQNRPAVFSGKMGATSSRCWCLPSVGKQSKTLQASPHSSDIYCRQWRLPRALANGHELRCWRGSHRVTWLEGYQSSCKWALTSLMDSLIILICLEAEHLLIPRKWWNKSRPGCGKLAPTTFHCHVEVQAQHCQSFHFC